MSKRIRLFGNDDDRPITAICDELNPRSALKKLIELDNPGSVHVGCSRDCIRSLVASERSGIRILKGDTTEVELDAELERDCVWLSKTGLFIPDDIVKLCSEVAEAMVTWPRMKTGMEAYMLGGVTEWDAGPMHTTIKFVSKPKPRGLHERPLSNIFHAFAKWLLEQWPDQDLSIEVLSKRFPLTKVREFLRRPFWHVAYDDNKPLPRAVLDLCLLIEAAFQQSQWARDVVATVKQFHERSVDLTRLFVDQGSVCMQILSDQMRAHRLRITTREHYLSAYTALVFPTAWSLNRNSSGIVFRVERF